MRLFIAIELSDELRNHLVEMQDRVRTLAPNLSFTRPHNLHLTLKFLGEVPDADVKGITDALAGIQPVGEFPFTTSGIVCFPECGRVRVVSADVEPPARLTQLQHLIDAAMEAKGFPRVRRPFHPHVTLARARTPLPAPVRKRLSAPDSAPDASTSMPANDFVLMQSRLHPKGAQYSPVARFYIKLPQL